MDPRQRLEREWKTIEYLIAAICRRRGLLDPADADAFATIVKLKLFENDCEIVRRFRGESRFSTYLGAVIHNTFVDFCVKRMGKWHASAAAERHGAIGVEIERLVHREGCAPDEAIARVQTAHPGVQREELAGILAELRTRPRRLAPLSLDALECDVADDAGADTLVVESDRRKLSGRVAAVVRKFLAALPDHDRLLLQYFFESDMQISQIARTLRVRQKPLYRRRVELLRALRAELAAAGVTAVEIRGLIGHLPEEADFGLRNPQLRPTEIEEEGVTAHPEIPT
jgi:RNA polymerase sigma factor (sigma-70 family)